MVFACLGIDYVKIPDLAAMLAEDSGSTAILAEDSGSVAILANGSGGAALT